MARPRKISNFFKAPKVKGMKRPEGAGNFDNMDDFNIVKATITVMNESERLTTGENAATQ